MPKGSKEPSEIKEQRWHGLVASLIANVSLFGALYIFRDSVTSLSGGLFPVDEQSQRFIQILPWVINLVVLVIAFELRPEFAIGWISFFAYLLMSTTALGVLFVAGCFVFIGLGAILSGSGCPGSLAAMIIPITIIFYETGKSTWQLKKFCLYLFDK